MAFHSTSPQQAIKFNQPSSIWFPPKFIRNNIYLYVDVINSDLTRPNKILLG